MIGAVRARMPATVAAAVRAPSPDPQMADTLTDASSQSASQRQRSTRHATEPGWTTDDSASMYSIRNWGKGFFDVNAKGHVVVRPTRNPAVEVDLYDVVAGMRERGFRTPVLVHFSDLLQRRLQDIAEAFSGAILEHGYRGRYTAVFPIKVNQQRRVVEEVRDAGGALGFGLEVGSKPELLAVMGMTGECRDRLIICNGFKEERYIEFTALAAKLGRQIIPVVENITELKLILRYYEAHGVRPRIGVRINLATQGAGRWRHSSGLKAKFGLSLNEVLEVLEILRARDMADCLQLLHCHMGSQIHDIRQVNQGVNELARIYAHLAKSGAGMRYLDIGGGLGVDYDGSQTNFEFSTNYTLQEYASNVVYKVMTVCDEEKVAHPIIVSESGRAMVAQQSVLIFDVLGANRLDRFTVPERLERPADGSELPRPLTDLFEVYQSISERRLLENYNDLLEDRDEALRLFSVGLMSLEHRALVDRIFWAGCAKVRDTARGMARPPEELGDLETALSDTYFCNLSIFQSMPDVWAINQLFPIMPIHRLEERPTRKATIADLTCDSDGKIDRFVDDHDVQKWLEVHDFTDGDEYLLGAFLVGAYQETLGDLHNLFGDTHVAHVKVDETGEWWIDEIIEGDAVRDVLTYVHYDLGRLFGEMRRECEKAVVSKQMTVAESQALLKQYEAGLSGYTYLETGG
jgi:arginine decarboxylase